jgi:flagellar protein FliS
MSSDLARNAYQQIEANGSNGVRLVIMLYDGAIRFLGDAKACAQQGDRRGKSAAISRSLAIVAELQSTLKIEEGGEIARSLDGLYTYITGRVLDASINGNEKGLDDALALLRVLHSAWSEIAQRNESPGTEKTSTNEATHSGDGLEFFG